MVTRQVILVHRTCRWIEVYGQYHGTHAVSSSSGMMSACTSVLTSLLHSLHSRFMSSYERFGRIALTIPGENGSIRLPANCRNSLNHSTAYCCMVTSVMTPDSLQRDIKTARLHDRHIGFGEQDYTAA